MMVVRSQPTGASHGARGLDRPARRRGLSLPEVLVVIGLILLLISMLFPSLNAARERLRRVQCANNLKQWGLALAAYRNDNNDYLPTEGTYLDLHKPYTWFNELPPYLGLPAYVDVDRFDELIKQFPDLSVWICPAKNRTQAYKSRSGKNQFHYGMNQVLDGLGAPPEGSADAPGSPDQGERPIGAHVFSRPAATVFMIEIVGNSPAGTPRDVATRYQRDFRGNRIGEFHGDFANLLYLDGGVTFCRTDDLVTDRDFRHGEIRWTHPRFFWGYTPPRE